MLLKSGLEGQVHWLRLYGFKGGEEEPIPHWIVPAISGLLRARLDG
jgi:hypothetical protein